MDDYTSLAEPPPFSSEASASPVDAFLAQSGLPGRSGAQSRLITGRCASDGLPGVDGGLAGVADAATEEPRRTPAGWLDPGVSDGCSTLIHERKTGSACETTTYEPISARANRYGIHHARALEMAGFCDDQAPHRAEKLRTCGAYLQFRNYLGEGQVRLTGGHFCQQDRLCGLCACRRGGRYLRAYVEKTRAVLAELPLRPYLVTLTVKDGEDLEERYTHLQKSIRRMMEARRDALKNRKRYAGSALTESCKAAGGVSSIEVKRGKFSGLWHPHSHAIWLCTDEPTRDALQAEWHEITGDSHVLDVRPFRFAQSSDAGDGATWEQMAGDFCEVFKYALKLNELSLDDNWTAFNQLLRKRMIEPFGVLRGVEIPEDLRDEPLAPDLPFIEILLRYVAREKAYREAGYTVHRFDPTRMSRWPRQTASNNSY